MQIEKWSNRLNIYDGANEQSKKIGELYGNSNNKLSKSISSSGKTLFIDFKKQYKHGDEKTEFEAIIKHENIISVCQTCLDINKSILLSPNHLNSNNCSWVITSNFGSYINLNFKFIEVNSKTRVIFVNLRK